MKNKLVILTSSIGKMGGAQMYVANKVNFFQSKGWEVFVFYYNYTEDILLPALKKYKDYYIPYLRHSFQSVPEKKRRDIIEKIMNVVEPQDSYVVIESQLVKFSFWAELIAENIGARHIINIIQEHIPVFTDNENAFFDYKLTRGDFMNASLPRLHDIFKDRFKEEYNNYARTISIPCENVVSDIEDTYEFEDCDYMILSIGRLDKSYIPTMNEEIKKFASLLKDKTVDVVYIGGSNEGNVEDDIPLVFKDLNNVRCYLLGFVFPIPSGLIKRANVAIACANSVLVAAKEGVPTIVVDINDYSAVGVFGYTTNDMFKRTTENWETISGLLYQVLMEGKFNNSEPSIVNKEDYDKVLEDELSFISRETEISYFDVNSIYPFFSRFVSKMKYLIKSLM